MKTSLFIKKSSMKNRLSAVLCLAGASIFFACQKTHDLSPPNHSSEELLSTTTGDVAMESVTGTCGQFRTQSQGGWGVNPMGENPGTYLRDHFAGSFPSGLTVGYSGGYTVSFTSAAAVTEFLPAGGTALALTSNSTNPLAKSIKNVLIGQVAALAINLAFDYNNPDFAPAEENLGNMLILTGAFSGMSVNEFLGIANSVLGGYSNAYTADQVNTTASLINANFIDGTVDAGFLGCPTTRFER
jgi:hypothetical protein